MQPSRRPTSSLLFSLCTLCALALCSTLVAGQAQNVGVLDSTAFMRTLTLSPGTWLPGPFQMNQTSYTLLLESNQGTINVYTEMLDLNGGSHVFQVGNAASYYVPNKQNSIVRVESGLTPLLITAYGKQGATKIIYQILIYRPALVASNNAELTGVTFSAGSLVPATWSAKTLTYDVQLGTANPSTLTITATAADSNEYIEIRVGNNNARTLTTGQGMTMAFDRTITQIRITAIAQSARVNNVYTFNFRRTGAAEEDPTTEAPSTTDPTPIPTPPGTTDPNTVDGAQTSTGGAAPDYTLRNSAKATSATLLSVMAAVLALALVL